MDSENNYDVKPVNHACGTNNNVIKPVPNSSSASASNNIQSVDNQSKVDSQYDNTNEIEVKPMYGGTYKKFKIEFKNETFYIKEHDEFNAIKKILKDRIFKKDYLLEIFENKKKSMYIINANYKNKFKKIH